METKSHDIRQIAQDLYPGYDRLEPLGQGGMGDLFKGRKAGLDVPVVVKVIKTNLKGRLDERQEAEILKGLKHKYLPRIYDVIENKDGFIYTIMDYIPGENLKDYVKRTGRVDQKTAFRWACQLCEVVAYLHEQTPAIIHSDIKPGNVMITPEGDVCLIDFNTSMEYRAGLTAIGKTKGYAAPEQYTKPEQVIRNMQAAAGLDTEDSEKTILIRQEPGSVDETLLKEYTGDSRQGTFTKSPKTAERSSAVSRWFRSSAISTVSTKSGTSDDYGTLSKRTDVYSIGATLYFALTAVNPPHALEPAKPLSKLGMRFSHSMVQIIERAMEKNPQDRFCDAAEMGKAFREIHRLEGSYRRIRLLSTAAVLLELVLLIGGIAMISAGSARLRQEQYNRYVQLLNDAQQEKNRDNFEQALQMTQMAQTMLDDRIEAYAEEAAVYYSQGINTMDAQLRREAFSNCVAQVHEILQGDFQGGSDAEWGKIYFVGAESCVELENYALAQKWYRMAIEHAPAENCYNGLIYACAFDRDMDGAMAALKEMQTAFPDADVQASAELIQAELCYLQKDYAGSVEHYKKFVGITNEESLLRRGYMAAHNACLMGGNEFTLQRIELLEEACRRIPASSEIFAPMLAGAYYLQASVDTQGQPDLWREKALETYESIALSFLGLEDRLNMNQIRMELGRLVQAEEDLLLMQQLYPEDYRIYKQMSGLYLLKFSMTGKISDRDKAEDAYFKARECYEKSGITDESMMKFIYDWQQFVRDKD